MEWYRHCWYSDCDCDCDCDSDVDVLVVVDTMEIRDALSEIAYDIMHEYGVIVAEVVQTKDYVEANEDQPFLKNVRREGRAYA